MVNGQQSNINKSINNELSNYSIVADHVTMEHCIAHEG